MARGSIEPIRSTFGFGEMHVSKQSGHAFLRRHARFKPYSCDVRRARAQCTLTACSSLLQALAIAASRLSVSMIGVPSAACRAKSFNPG